MPILLAAALAAATPVPAAPRLTREEVLQLFSAAGFKVDTGHPVNMCGEASSPRVRFVDMNGDNTPEAEIVDVAPSCYGKPGVHYVILQRGADRLWHAVLSDDGIPSFPGTTTNSWKDIDVEKGQGACPGPRRFANGHYHGTCGDIASAMPAPTPQRRSGPARNALQPLPEDEAADKASLAGLTAEDRVAIFKAAGASPVGRGQWTMCTDDKADRSTISSARDINGDGRPDAIVTDSGASTMCYGNTGQAYALVSKQANGRWVKMTDAIAIPMLLSGRGVDGYPDIANGGPGMCFLVVRWNGRTYQEIGGTDGDGHACSLK